MTGTNAEKAHYKRIQRARRVAEGMVRVDCWLPGGLASDLDAWAKDNGFTRSEAVVELLWWHFEVGSDAL